MDWERYLDDSNEKPLDNIVQGYSRTSIFRKMAFIGDSLSSGEFENRDENNNPGYFDVFEYSWGQYIARKNGLTAYNFSRGGMTCKEYVQTYADKKGFWDKEKACQAYVIALGINDICRELPIGSFDDVDKDNWKNNNTDTVIGAYATIIQRYKEISPKAKFFFVTIPNDGRPEKEKEFSDILFKYTEMFSNCYVIDLRTYGPNYKSSDFRKKFYLYGHLNPSGYIFTAELIDSYIDYIVRHNPDDFKEMGFVGFTLKDVREEE